MAFSGAFASLCLVFLLVASPCYCMQGCFLLYSGETLRNEQELNWGSYTFIMQHDCNLVLYENGEPLWASNTGGLAKQCYAILHESDSNLVIYDGENNVVWSTDNNRGQGNYVLVLQKDRNVVIYGPAIWATNTNTIKGVSRGMFIESKATTFAALPANKTTAKVKAARVSMVVEE